MWFEIHEAERCPSCGTRPDEWDPKEGGHPNAYTWERHTCQGCVTKAQGEARLGDQDRAGVTVRLTRNPEVTR